MRSHLLVVTLLTAAAVAAAAFPATADADDFRSRAGRWEFNIQMRYLGGESFDTQGGSVVDTNSDVGWGFGFAYNFNDHLALGMDFGWNSPTYDANIVSASTPGVSRQVSAEMSTSSIHFNLLYNILKGPVTPYVSAGIGSTYIDTNIPSGLATTSCWWDPWYGYVCYGYQPTYAASRFSYNAMAGIRWDLSREVFLRAGVGMQWIDLAHGGDQGFPGARFEIGFSY